MIRHFVRALLDHDLISPHVDRHETVAVAIAAVISSGLFLSLLLTLKYLFQPFQSPGMTAVAALDDHFFFITATMVVMGLVGIAVWDQLVLDRRDIANLGTLPIPYQLIVRAKLKAVALFAVCFALALGVIPGVLHPILMAGKLDVSVLGVIMLSGTFTTVLVSAGGFGFLCVLGLRGIVQATVGTARSSRLPTVVQALLVLMLATVLLLVPTLSSGVARRWLSSSVWTRLVAPPLWFVGLHEWVAGGVLDGLPRGDLPPRTLRMETIATTLYRSHQATFQTLGSWALVGLGLALLVGISLYLWNSRAWSTPPAVSRTRRGAVRLAVARMAERLLARPPAVQAGFWFALRTLPRSLSHRLAIATSTAVGLAVGAVSLRGVEITAAADVAAVPVTLVAIQTVVVTALMIGFRHAMRLPADLRASWVFRLVGLQDERAFLVGVKRAGYLALTLPALLALLPIHVVVLGIGPALVHLVAGLLVSVLLLDGLCLGHRRLPFTTAYSPSGNLPGRVPIYAAICLIVVYGFAWLERVALQNAQSRVGLLGVLALLSLGMKVADRWQRRGSTADLEPAVPDALVHLGLGG